MDVCMDGWMDAWLNGWMDGWMDGCMYSNCSPCSLVDLERKMCQWHSTENLTRIRPQEVLFLAPCAVQHLLTFIEVKRSPKNIP